MKTIRFKLLLAAAATAALVACGKAEPPRKPVEITTATACALDGMTLADYPGPKAQIHYATQENPDFFCDTVEMFSIYLNPEQVRNVKAVYVQDMATTKWEKPDGAWIDAKTAFYVVGSKLHGSMGPTFASFAKEADAARFAEQYGGKVYAFADITPEMASLDGGALHDHTM
jgi:copper chaperone NosL